MIQSRRMIMGAHAALARMGEMRNTCRILAGKSENKEKITWEN
jgi:hypothetical protein